MSAYRGRQGSRGQRNPAQFGWLHRDREDGVSVKQAKELATRLWEAGEPAGCAWCVRLDERTKRRLQTGLEPLERECRSTQGWQDGTMKAA